MKRNRTEDTQTNENLKKRRKIEKSINPFRIPRTNGNQSQHLLQNMNEGSEHVSKVEQKKGGTPSFDSSFFHDFERLMNENQQLQNNFEHSLEGEKVPIKKENEDNKVKEKKPTAENSKGIQQEKNEQTKKEMNQLKDSKEVNIQEKKDQETHTTKKEVKQEKPEKNNKQVEGKIEAVMEKKVELKEKKEAIKIEANQKSVEEMHKNKNGEKEVKGVLATVKKNEKCIQTLSINVELQLKEEIDKLKKENSEMSKLYLLAKKRNEEFIKNLEIIKKNQTELNKYLRTQI